MKFEGTLNNIPIYSSPNCEKDTIYFVNDKKFEFNKEKIVDRRRTNMTLDTLLFILICIFLAGFVYAMCFLVLLMLQLEGIIR